MVPALWPPGVSTQSETSKFRFWPTLVAHEPE